MIVLKDQNDTQLLTSKGNYIRQEEYDKLKQENKAQKEKLDNIKYLCETTGLDNYYLVPIIKTEIILQILKGE